MTGNRKSRMAWVLGILLLVLAVIVLVFAHGLRRWYSGFFLAIMGTVSLLNAMRWRGSAED